MTVSDFFDRFSFLEHVFLFLLPVALCMYHIAVMTVDRSTGEPSSWRTTSGFFHRLSSDGGVFDHFVWARSVDALLFLQSFARVRPSLLQLFWLLCVLTSV